jgi:predicted secreted hydrolase
MAMHAVTRVTMFVLSNPRRFLQPLRTFATFVLSFSLLWTSLGQCAEYPEVRAGHRLQFPRDHGAHPQFRTEWWYVTGWLATAEGKEIGFQVTFFRSRPGLQEDNPSRFAPKQMLFAHAALADPETGRLRHHQRAARDGFDLAYAREADTDVRIGDWHLVHADGKYRTRVRGSDFSLELSFTASSAPLLQGIGGYSRKGPQARQASYYYSRPQLAVSGQIEIEGRRTSISGKAWLDHEWSSEYLSKQASGWDWIGINLVDGGALMAFRIRSHAGEPIWAGGTIRSADGTVTRLQRTDVEFTPLRRWRSPRTDAEYPVAIRVRAGEQTMELHPLMVDQELDSRASTGVIYWEGAVTARSEGRTIGRGYLELTGYAGRLDI